MGIRNIDSTNVAHRGANACGFLLTASCSCRKVRDAVRESDQVFIAGEASSHCVLASVRQLVEYFAAYREITSRITLLEDCMSPIAGFEESTMLAFQELKDQYGIHIRKSVEVTI